jgi:chromosome segregation ATPase
VTNNNVTAKYEEERLRAQEQSQIVYLQGQIDELRRLLKDQTNKYNWAMEQLRKTEGAVAQVQILFERHANEMSQLFEGARREVATLRKEISTALLKIDEGVRPIREMQSQIHQLAEARKQDRDQVFPWFARIEELEQRLQTTLSTSREFEDRHRQLALQLERLREVDGAMAQDMRKLGEELQIEKQSLRRQAVEAQQLVADVRQELDDHRARIERLDELRQRIELFSQQLPERIEEVAGKMPELTGEIKRVERVSTERFLMNQERLEELRHQSDEKLVELRDSDEQNLRQTTAWLERLDAWCRELEQRLARGVGRLEESQLRHSAQIGELRQRELRMLENIAAAFGEQLMLSKAEQTDETQQG